MEIYLTLLRIVKKWLRAGDQPIYLHCFNGDAYVLQRWMNQYSNLYVGFTRLVERFSSNQVEALQQVPSNRILLETDAPYFSGRGQKVSAPNRLFGVAQCVGGRYGMTPNALLEATCQNANRLFMHQ